jgi:hypothetical protein
MEALILFLGSAGVALGFGLLAIAFGADSRDGIGDDHARPVSF